MSAYKGFTEAQARAHKKYMEGVATIQIRMTPERREELKAAAAASGESLNVFINRALGEALEPSVELEAAEAAPVREIIEAAAAPAEAPKLHDFLSEEQLSKVRKFGKDYRILDENGQVDLDAALRRIVEKFGEAIALSDYIDTWTQTLLRASSVLVRQAESAERERRAAPEAIEQLASLGNNVAWVACFLNKEFNYEENRPDVSQPAFEFRRFPGGKLHVKAQKRMYEK